MSENIMLVPARLKSSVPGGHVVGADMVFDDTQGKTQEEINAGIVSAEDIRQQVKEAITGETDDIVGNKVDEKIGQMLEDPESPLKSEINTTVHETIDAADIKGATYKLGINGVVHGDEDGKSLGSVYAATTPGRNGQVLKSSGTGAPVWEDLSEGVGAEQVTQIVNQEIYGDEIKPEGAYAISSENFADELSNAINGGLTTEMNGLVSQIVDEKLQNLPSEDTNTTYKLSVNGTVNGDGNGVSLGSVYAPAAGGTEGQYLSSKGDAAPEWKDFPEVLGTEDVTAIVNQQVYGGDVKPDGVENITTDNFSDNLTEALDGSIGDALDGKINSALETKLENLEIDTDTKYYLNINGVPGSSTEGAQCLGNVYSPNASGLTGQYLKSNGENGVPSWEDFPHVPTTEDINGLINTALYGSESKPEDVGPVTSGNLADAVSAIIGNGDLDDAIGNVVSEKETTYKLTLNGQVRGDTEKGQDLGSFYAPTTIGTPGQILACVDSTPTPNCSWVDAFGKHGYIAANVNKILYQELYGSDKKPEDAWLTADFIEKLKASVDKVNVPVLATAPTSSTLQYTQDGETKNFQVDQLCKVKDTVNGDAERNYWVYYRLCDIVNGTAYWGKEVAAQSTEPVEPEPVEGENYLLTSTMPTADSIAASLDVNAVKPEGAQPLETPALTKPTLLYLVYPIEWEEQENGLLTKPVILDSNGFEQGIFFDENDHAVIDGKTYRIANVELGVDNYTIEF